MSEENFVVAGKIDRDAREPFEVGTVQYIRRPGAGGRAAMSAGYWFITPEEAPEPMRIVGHADEAIYIVEGRVRITPEGGESVELAAGSSASMNSGSPVVWEILEPSVEFFVYS